MDQATPTKPNPLKMPDQRSVTDQLRDLVVMANRAGMYDAADLINLTLLPRDARLTSGEILVRVFPTPLSDGTEKG